MSKKNDCLEVEINRHYSKWRSISIRLLKDKEDGEDLLQSILCDLLQNDKARYIACEQEVKGSLFYYVCRSLWNRALTYKQKQKDRPISIDQLPELIEEDNEIVNNGEKFDVVINWLTDYQIQLIELKAVHGLTISEISRETKLPRSTLTTDIHRAMKLIKKYSGDA